MFLLECSFGLHSIKSSFVVPFFHPSSCICYANNVCDTLFLGKVVKVTTLIPC